jgi:parvulin-like peptidyl-prolyl cis-trans isomerase-like protein
MKRYLKEPLLHFLIFGGLLFGAYAWLNPVARNANTEPRQVRIGAGEVRWVTETWTRQWHREPSAEELRALVMNLLKEELFAREAREMRLDENDTIVRRRLAQKLEFFLQDTVQVAQPTENDLRSFYDAHPERFATEGRVSFTQVFFSRERRKDAALDARAALARLSNATPTDIGATGDRLLLDAEFRDADEPTVASAFGPDFARAVFVLRPGAWHGPIESGYGLHLVYVGKSQAARRREFADVRSQVLEHWRDQQQREGEKRYFARLMQKYNVVVDDSVKSLVGPLSAAQATGVVR